MTYCHLDSNSESTEWDLWWSENDWVKISDPVYHFALNYSHIFFLCVTSSCTCGITCCCVSLVLFFAAQMCQILTSAFKQNRFWTCRFAHSINASSNQMLNLRFLMVLKCNESCDCDNMWSSDYFCCETFLCIQDHWPTDTHYTLAHTLIFASDWERVCKHSPQTAQHVIM